MKYDFLEDFFFTRDDLRRYFKNEKSMDKCLRTLVNEGRIKPVAGELYGTVNPVTWEIYGDRYEIAAALFPDSYIAYHTALEYYGRTANILKEVQIVSPQPVDVTVCGMHFISVASNALSHMAGNGNEEDSVSAGQDADNVIPGADNVALDESKNGDTDADGEDSDDEDREDGVYATLDNTTLYITDLERTVTDCIDRMDLGGGLDEVCAAILHCIKLDEKKLLKYLHGYSKGSMYKKCGYLLSKFMLTPMSSDFLDMCKASMSAEDEYLIAPMLSEPDSPVSVSHDSDSQVSELSDNNTDYKSGNRSYINSDSCSDNNNVMCIGIAKL